MILTGKFVLINIESRESNGKMYSSANIEDCEDGEVCQIGVDESAVPMLSQKYKVYDGFFKVGEYYVKDKGKQVYRKLLSATLDVK